MSHPLSYEYKGNQCPACGDKDIRAESPVPEDYNWIHMEACCNKCNASWTESYRLDGFHELYGGNGEPVIDNSSNGPGSYNRILSSYGQLLKSVSKLTRKKDTIQLFETLIEEHEQILENS